MGGGTEKLIMGIIRDLGRKNDGNGLKFEGMKRRNQERGGIRREEAFKQSVCLSASFEIFAILEEFKSF